MMKYGLRIENPGISRSNLLDPIFLVKRYGSETRFELADMRRQSSGLLGVSPSLYSRRGHRLRMHFFSGLLRPLRSLITTCSPSFNPERFRASLLVCSPNLHRTLVH